MKSKTKKTDIPEDVTAAIKSAWPHGVVEEFDKDESYFHALCSALERDLEKMGTTALLWQTEEQTEPPSSPDFQSYHVYFLVPHGEEFRFQAETDNLTAPGDPEEPDCDATVRGDGWIGFAVGISLAAPFAVINLTSHARYEDGSIDLPDVESTIYSTDTGRRIDPDEYFRNMLPHAAFETLPPLRNEIASIIASHGIRVLDDALLNLRVPGLKADQEVFLQGPLRVRDAFFFSGV
jgi:hypothetical protein